MHMQESEKWNYELIFNKNPSCGTWYLSHCCRLKCCGDTKPQMYTGHVIMTSTSNSNQNGVRSEKMTLDSSSKI